MMGETGECGLLSLIKTNNLMELFPRILNVEKENFVLTPSEFLRQMSLTTEERHKMLVHNGNVKSVFDYGFPKCLKVIPSILVFQRFEGRSRQTVTLNVINMGRSMLPLKIHCPPSIHFSAVSSGVNSLKLAPGLSLEYEVTFTPKEVKDYCHYLIFKCKDDTFYLPIVAFGPRALLDMPNQITLNPAPVKLSIDKCIVLRNIGDVPASFNFVTDRPFKIIPTKGYLAAHESMIITVSFQSPKIGEVTGKLYLILETGEKLTINLYGASENVSVRLEKNSVVHEDTFLGLKHCKSLRLYNNSSNVLRYSWKKNPTAEDDLNIVEGLKPKYEEMAKMLKNRGTHLEYFDLCSFESHKNSCERVLQDELLSLEREEFEFCHKSFDITPQKGEIWPNGSVEFVVSFEPKTCATITTHAYLEVTGRESRLPLQIRGHGLGPKIILNPQTLDVDYIYLCSYHKYEVIAANTGDIPGHIQYRNEPSVFGGKINVEPASRRLKPGECAAFIVSFTSNKQGDFIEQLSFTIVESNEMVSFILTGKIVCPTLHFDKRKIDFGLVPFGFPTSQEVTLNNLSVVPVTFSLKVSRDGETPSFSYKMFSSQSMIPRLPTTPKEFHIDPQESVVEPFSSKKVTLTLTANKAGRFQTNLEMDMWDSETSSVACPIRYHAAIPTIIAEPDSLNIPFCFINFPYTRSINLRNTSKVSGFFCILPPDPNEYSAMTCSPSIPQGVIEPSSAVKIDVTLITSALGRQFLPINLLVLGHEGYYQICMISCIGQGPVVTVSPNSLHWGETTLLEETKKTLLIANESPIPATFTIALAKPNSPWFIEKSDFTLASSDQIAVDVNLRLRDRGKFNDILKCDIHNGKVLNIHLSATGVGSSLKIQPKIYPTFDLETLFSHKTYDIEIDIENQGSKSYGLVWSPFQDYGHFVSLKCVNPSNLLFKFEPTKMDLLPGERKTLHLIAQSSQTGFCLQTFYCFASIGVPSKELHFTTDVFAEFVEPLIDFDKRELRYWYNIGCEFADEKSEDEVEVSNKSALSLRVHFSVRHPFRIQISPAQYEQTYQTTLMGNSTEKLTIQFQPEIKSEPISRVFNESLNVTFEEHSKKFTLSLHGEINYPTLLIRPKCMNFDYVPVAVNVCKEITLVNISPLTIYFHIAWNASTATLVEPAGEINQSQLSEELEKNFNEENKQNTNSNFSEEDEEDARKLSVDARKLESAPNLEVSVLKMPEIVVSKAEIKKAMFSVVKKYYVCEEELINAYKMTRASDLECNECVPHYTKVCDITPLYGKLEKYSSQILSVRFCSETPATLHLEATINVKSGPTEIITIDAVASEINFAVDKTELDFGKQLFCKPTSQTLKIQNNGAMPFTYDVVLSQEQTLNKSECTPEIGHLMVSPSNGNVASFSEAEINVSYHPRIPGSFERKFRLHICHLEPVLITVRGFGVFPQMYLALPRTEMMQISPGIGYLATANITSSWLLNEPPVSSLCDIYYIKPYRSQESNLDGISGYEEATSFSEDWEFVQHLECIPTDVDIQLAVERALANALMSKDPDNQATFAVYARTIPQFVVPAYEIDLGTVVIGRVVEKTVTVTNYGPLPVIFYLRFDTHFKEDGFQVRLKNRNELAVGVNMTFTLSFSPRHSKFNKEIEIVETVFYLEVYHGAKIPIKIFATVTYPHVLASSLVLDYSDIVCGCCKVMNLKLKNPGLTPANWSMALLPAIQNVYNANERADGRNMFHLNYKSGLLNPDEYCTIQISFKPDYEDNFSTLLCVQVAESFNDVKILLMGTGVEPKLSLSESVLFFGPTTPYPNKLDKYITVENPCSFPIELYFPTFDDQIFEEDKILRAVCTYYQSQEILLPVRKPGEGLPVELVNFYQILLEDLNAKYLEQEREKIENLDESLSAVFSSEDDHLVPVSSQMSFAERKKRKARKSLTRTRTAVDSSRTVLADANSRKNESVHTVFDKKTPLEIEEMLLDHIRQLLNTNPEYDPIQAILRSTLPIPKEEEYKEGLLIFFHGAPYTNSVQLANRAALHTGHVALSIDRIVLEEATYARCEAGLAARELIEDAYWDHVEMRAENGYPEMNDHGPDFGSALEEIERKFEALLSLREYLLTTKGKQLAKTSSAKSEVSKKADKPVTPALKPMNLNAPLANITEELVVEILKFRIPLEIEKGMMLETLSSVFINSKVKALTSVLKAAGNIKDIIAIFLLNNYFQYSQCLLEKQLQQENAKLQEQEEMLNLLEEEDEETILRWLQCNVEKEKEFAQIRQIFLDRRHANFELFQKQKSEFYEAVRQKNIRSKVKGNAVTQQAFGEKKKEIPKTVKQSEISGGRAVSEDKAAKNKKDPVEQEFAVFETELAELKAIVENWDQRIGAAITEATVDAAKNKKGQTPRKTSEVSAQMSRMNPPKGIHIWLADVSRPEKNLFGGVCCFLKSVLENRRVPRESDYWPLTKTESMTFSVISYPPLRERPPISDVYTLAQSEKEEENGEGESMNYSGSGNMKLNRSSSQMSFRGKRKGSVTAKRKREDSRMSTDSKGLRKPSSKDLQGKFKSRWIIQPGETETWRVRYFPTETGETKQIYPVNVVNWQNDNAIYCMGICDFPALDMTPEMVYPVVVPITSNTSFEIFTPAYFYLDDAYDFGSIIYVQRNDFSKRPEKKADLTLFNKSTLPVNLTITSSLDATGEDLSLPHMRYEPDKMFLQPGESGSLSVIVSPNKYGQQTETLMLMIKDNPKIEMIKVKFEGVKANVTAEPKSINFDRILLRRKDNREIIFSNNNRTPLYVNLVDLDKTPSQFVFSSTGGCIPPLGTIKVGISYEATEIQQVVDFPFQVQVFDDPISTDPVQEFPMTLTAEAYDVALDIIFADKDSNHIDFGLIRMRTDCVNVFNLRNIGKYPFGFRIALNKNFLDNYENEQFSLNPEEGVLQPGKLFPITASIFAITELAWKREQLFKIELIEPNKNDELVARIPLEVSATSHFPRYEITPFPNLNFGHIRVASVATELIRIENQGCFPLHFFVEAPSQAPGKAEEAPKKGSKPTASTREKEGKKNSPALVVGPFEISPTFGIIDVGQAASFNVTVNVPGVDSYEEKIIITTNESPSLTQEKREMLMTVTSCLPAVNFADSKALFREHFTAKSESEFPCPMKFEPYTLYTENDSLLSFKNACVCKHMEARIHISNSGLIECLVRAKITSQSEEGSRYDVAKNLIQFSVSPPEILIEPYNSGIFTVTFRPEAIQDYRAWLNLSLEMPDKYEDETCRFGLFGNGVLPQIEIVQPPVKLPEGPTLVNFGPTAPGRYSTAAISFTNVGPLACKVIIELCNNQERVFTLIPQGETEKMLSIWETKPIDHTIMVSTLPGEMAEFTVIFSPKEVKSYSSQIKLFPVDNPFENPSFKLTGDGFFEEVTIDKIRTEHPFFTDDFCECDQTSVYATPFQFALNLNDCPMQKDTKALLRLLNKTENDYFKFKWENLVNFTVSPSVGHLYPNTYKEILIKFKPEEPIELDEVPLICTLNKISFESETLSHPAWDSRMVLPKNKCELPRTPMLPETSSKKDGSRFHSNTEETKDSDEDEPPCEIIPETNRMLFVNVSARADYAYLHCDSTDILFKNTFMFQTRIHSLVLKNAGNVALNYKVLMSSVTASPTPDSSTCHSKEEFLTKDESLESERPQSWVNSCSTGSSVIDHAGRPASRCQPRPLTSGSLLDLDSRPQNTTAEESVTLDEESRVTAYNPFLLENSSGRILPRETVTCNVIFSPMDVSKYKTWLNIHVPNLHPECNLPRIQITASSIMPYCHFNIPESDYLESGRRDCSRVGPIGSTPGLPLDPDIKTIEIKVLGIGHTNPIKFHVINPTEQDYRFSWVNVTQVQLDVVQSFHCSTLDGRIQAGRQQQMIFDFVSKEVGIVESFWKFVIPEYGVETLFLFVADVREPSIYFVESHVNLKPTFTGVCTSKKLTLVNHEDAFFEFKFLPDSLYSEGRQHCLNVEPSSGKIPPQSEIPIMISFLGKTGGKVLFFLKCKIKCIPEVFTIAVEATTYVVQPLIVYEDPTKVKRSVKPDQENIIDFGSELTPNHSCTVTFFLTSVSKTSFYYDWIYNKSALQSKFCKLKFSPKNGHVASFCKAKCDVTIIFLKKSSLSNYPVTLKVRRGPTFHFLLFASASTPTIEFSSSSFDFGYCFLQERDICYNELFLTIINRDAFNLTLEANLPEASAFSYCLPKSTIQPGEDVNVSLRFHPKEKIPYLDILKFTINELYEKSIHLKGHGTEFKVTLENAECATVSMGPVKIGKTCLRKFGLVNKSLAPANLLLGFSDQFPVSGTRLITSGQNQNPIDLSKDHRLSGTLTIEPTKVFTVQPKEIFTVAISYTPTALCPRFAETVCIQCQDRAEPICMVTGCCIGPDISLDRAFLNFGAVVQDCSIIKKLKILNSGNIGARFQWMTDTLEKDFSIYPQYGYSSPESDVTIQIKFHPTVISNCITSTVECSLFLSDSEAYPPLVLAITGSCVGAPQPEATVSFECLVRQTDSKTVTIYNWSGNEWQLFPVFSGDYFKGGDALVIPPLTNADYEIEYSPLTMSPKGTFHEGSLFFRLPNGQCLLFNMKGTSLPPSAEDIITREVPCKTKYVELLKIQNWLKQTQRFQVKIECTTKSGQEEPTWICNGLTNLNLPPLAEKDYNLNFFSYKPGNPKYQIFFINEETQEYVWFDVTFKVVMCGPLEIITMKCGVRQTCHREIKLENPLEKPIQYKLSTSNPEIHFEKAVLTVSPGEKVYAKLFFTPLHARDRTDQMTAECPELGIFPWELRLLALEAPPELVTTFETPFGSSKTKIINVKNFSPKNATFQCKVDSGDFTVRETEYASPGQEIQIKVTHEPSELGTAIGTLFIESEEAGNFTFPLSGICVKSLAKGPYLVKPGAGTYISFKNVFKKPKDFYMYVDNPAFVLRTSQENIPAKAEFDIQVGLQKEKHLEKLTSGKIEGRFPFMGQLVVECYNPYVKWQFYLKGVVD